MLLLLFENGFLRMFIDNIEPDDWADTSQNWVITAVVVAILGAGLVFAFKAFRKSMAEIAKKKIWTRRQSWLMIFVGIFPIFLSLLIIWYMKLDFYNFIGMGGLLNATLFAWLLYVLLMVIGHLVSPWRRELI